MLLLFPYITLHDEKIFPSLLYRSIMAKNSLDDLIYIGAPVFATIAVLLAI